MSWFILLPIAIIETYSTSNPLAKKNLIVISDKWQVLAKLIKPNHLIWIAKGFFFKVNVISFEIYLQPKPACTFNS